jgi:hypothetical protein
MTDKQQSPAGEYYLRGVMDMACGFKLEEDHTFQFFLAYGALDRYGSGKWKIEGETIVLQSQSWSGKDFALVTSKKTTDEGVTISVTDPNPNILRYVFATLKNSAEGGWQHGDTDGVIKLPAEPVSSISLVFEFCPERFSVFKIDDPSHNYFEFRFEPWIFEFFFNDFRLQLTEGGLKGPHPLMEGEEFSYVKNS